MTLRDFYGEGLNQTREDKGKVVKMAGVIFDVSQGLLRTRVHNRNVSYAQDGTDSYNFQAFRFRSGREFFQHKQQKGQAYGHVCRVLDNSNLYSMDQVPRDLFYLFTELRSSGWPPGVFEHALRKALSNSPALRPVARMTRMLLSRCAEKP